MKTYLSVGIGDMMCLDSVLTQNERNNISEIYWACRFGRHISPLLENNPFYPNLKHQYFISDDDGKRVMNTLDNVAINFWHFRPDFQVNFDAGLSLFGLSRESVNPINAASIFLDSSRIFTNSSFLDNATENDVNWKELKISPKKYILFHYPTSTRPRSDIATINNSDFEFINNLSNSTGLKIIIITDTDFNHNFTNFLTLKNPEIKSIVALCKYSEYYVGCDSFVSILCSKVLQPDNLYIKSHNSDIYNEVLRNTWLQRFFLPHQPQTIVKFYKNYIG